MLHPSHQKNVQSHLSPRQVRSAWKGKSKGTTANSLCNFVAARFPRAFAVVASVTATFFALYCLTTDRVVRDTQKQLVEMPSHRTPGVNLDLLVFTVTWYKDTKDIRMDMCVATLKALVQNSISVIVVDGSPSEEVHSVIQSTGANVHRQTSEGGKGAALREAVALARRMSRVTDETWLCWQEPEKTDMARIWRPTLMRSLRTSPTEVDNTNADVIVPYRTEQDFRETYPIEQFHSETYGNMYLDSVAAEALARSTEKGLPPFPKRLDWHFGPFAFRAKHWELWTLYRLGDSYDAQVVPIVHAARKGLRVASVNVDYGAPLEMKEQETSNVKFIEKRLMQLNILDPRVKKAWTEAFYC